MADIDIVRKRPTSTWVWVVVVLALIALLWFFVAALGEAATGQAVNGSRVAADDGSQPRVAAVHSQAA